MVRAPCCEKVGLKRGRWTAEEDELLTKYIQDHGEGSWRSLPKNAGLLRCGKSCRLRWINYLRAGLKRGNITSDEEELIIKLHSSLGNRWSLIASHLPGRTDNEIKNYWNSHLSRRAHIYNRPSGLEHLPLAQEMTKVGLPTKRRGGRTNRWAMKKNKNSLSKSQAFSPNVVRLEEPNLPLSPPSREEALEVDPSVEVVLNACPIQETEGGILGLMEEKKGGQLVMVDANEPLTINEDYLVHGEEKGNEVEEIDTKKIKNRKEDLDMGNMSSNIGESCEWYSTSSIASGGVDDCELDWTWEVVGQGQEIWEKKVDYTLASLWENENIFEAGVDKLGNDFMGHEKENANMVSWLPS